MLRPHANGPVPIHHEQPFFVQAKGFRVRQWARLVPHGHDARRRCYYNLEDVGGWVGYVIYTVLYLVFVEIGVRDLPVPCFLFFKSATSRCFLALEECSLLSAASVGHIAKHAIAVRSPYATMVHWHKGYSFGSRGIFVAITLVRFAAATVFPSVGMLRLIRCRVAFVAPFTRCFCSGV